MTNTATTSPRLAQRLSGAVVSLRADLDFSRHVFADGPAYVVRDPINFKTHRFSAADYRILLELTSERPLRDIFESLAAARVIDRAADEEPFYEFILSLHRLGLLSLPVNDGASLYDRYQRRRAAEARSRWLSILSFRVPICDPSAFLRATAHVVRPLFSLWAVIAWALLMLAAGCVAAARWDELAAPVLSIFQFENLALLWIILVVLKVLHELGHAYACRILGGHVPEMGAMFVIFTPCAYVDASDSWRFPSRKHRIAVILAGMYVESIIGALAMFVWASTSPSLINTIAYQVIILSTVVTLGFNLNPLMRFDGYYLFSDLLNIPNLRQRAEDCLLDWFNRVALGLPMPTLAEGRARAAFLPIFGAASIIYRTMLTLGIAGIVAHKLGIPGLILGVAFAGAALARGSFRALRYLWASPRTAPVRVRAALAGLALAAGALIALAAAPVSLPLTAAGVLDRERVFTARAPFPARIAEVNAAAGDSITAGAPLIRLENPDVQFQPAIAASELRVIEIGLVRELSPRAGRAPTTPAIDEPARRAAVQRLADAQRRAESLVIAAPHDGVVTEDSLARPGACVQPGAPLATVVSGGWVARFLVPSEDLQQLRITVGDRATCRAVADPSLSLDGIIQKIAPAASRRIDLFELTDQAGGEIPLVPGTRDAARSYVEITLALDHQPHLALSRSATLKLSLPGTPRTLAAHAARFARRFISDLRTE